MSEPSMVTSSFWLWAAQRSFYLKHVRVSTVRRATEHQVKRPAQIPGVRMAEISKLSGFSRRLMAPPRLDRVAAACVAS